MESDKELFNDLIKGNREAFEALFRMYYAPLARFAILFVKSEQHADDVVQSFFVKLWQQKDKIRITTSVKSYFYTSVRNISLNFLQKEKTKALFEDAYSTEQQIETEVKENIPINELVSKAVNLLPDRTKEIFLLCKNEGLTYSEIASYLQISAKTVENNMGIAFKKIREFLLPYKHLIFE